MGINYPSQSAIAAVLESIGQQKKKKAMEDTLDRARQKGYDIEITIDPETGKQATKLHYKGKSQSDMVKDQFDVAKMLAEMQKWKRGEEVAQKGEEFQGTAESAYGGAMEEPVASVFGRPVTRGQTIQAKPYMDWRRNFERAGQTLIPTEKGWARTKLPVKKSTKPTLTETFRTDFQDLIGALGQIDILPIGRQEKVIRRNKAKKMFLDKYPDKALTMQDYFQNIKPLR